MLLRTLRRMHFITLYPMLLVIIYASMISCSVLMHIRSFEGIILLEFEEELKEQQEAPQAVAPEGEEQTLEDLTKCPDHRPTSLSKASPRAF